MKLHEKFCQRKRMQMETQKYLEILRSIRDCAFATMDRNGLPAVRIIDVMLSVRSSASRKASRTRLRPHTACTADFVLKAVLWKRSKGWAARRID